MTKSFFVTGISLLLLATITTPICYGDGEGNPTGVYGVFNGNSTTGCNYDPFTGNAMRVVDDIVVPGSVGAYPLKWTRYANSRNKDNANLRKGGWNFSYDYDLGHMPDGRSIGGLGVPEFVGGYSDANGPNQTAIHLADGGVVVFGNFYTTWVSYTEVTCNCKRWLASSHIDPVKLIDPYGNVTRFEYQEIWHHPNSTPPDKKLLGKRRVKIIEPGGRYLKLYWENPEDLYNHILTKVEAYDGVNNSTPIESVVYTYKDWIGPANAGESDPFKHYPVMSDVAYSDGTHATYKYSAVNNGPLPNRPALSTASDVRYAGPMRDIAYDYVHNPDSTVSPGVLLHEKTLDGQIVAARGSQVIIGQNSAGQQAEIFEAIELRGDGARRVFHYEGVSFQAGQNVDPLTGRLLEFTDFEGNLTKLSYTDWPSNSGWGYVNAVTDANNHKTVYHREKVGSVWQIDRPGGSTIKQTYTGCANDQCILPYYLATRTDELGHQTKYIRDAKNRISEIQHLAEDDSTIIASEGFDYNNFGQITRHRLANLAYEHFEYDGRGLLRTKWEPTSHSVAQANDAHTTYTYYPSGDPWVDRIFEEVDPRGNVTRYEYDRAYASGVTNPVGAHIPGHGLITQIKHVSDTHDGTISGGTAQTFGYNKYGDKMWEEDELGHRTTYVRDIFGRVTSAIAPLNRITQYAYDSTFVPTSHNQNGANEEGDPSDTAYEPPSDCDNANSFVNPDPNLCLNDPDASCVWPSNPDLRCQILHGQGGAPPLKLIVSGFGRNESNGVYTLNDDFTYWNGTDSIALVAGHWYITSDDDWYYCTQSGLTSPNQCSSWQAISGVAPAGTFVVSNPYSSYESVVGDGEGQNTNSPVFGSTSPFSHTSSLPSLVTTPGAVKTKTTYDGNWRKLSVSVAYETSDVATSFFEYDPVGNLLTSTSPRGKITKFLYDVRDRQIWITDPLGELGDPEHTTIFTYDDAGNKRTERHPKPSPDKEGQLITYDQYDAMNRLLQVTTEHDDGAFYSRCMTYFPSGMIETRTDENVNTYSYTYDPSNRVAEVHYPASEEGPTVEFFYYDPNGNLDIHNTRAGQVETITYDERNRQKSVVWDDGITASVWSSYDAAGRLSEQDGDYGSLNYTYDDANRLTSETQTPFYMTSRTFSYDYNTSTDLLAADGLRTGIHYPNDTAVSFTYTKRHQIKAITSSVGSATYTYDEDGNELTRSVSNSTSETCSYDNLDRLTWINHKKGSNSFDRFDYSYNNVGDRLSRTQTDTGYPNAGAKTDRYTFDLDNQLTGVRYNFNSANNTASKTVDYRYDGAGNRLYTIEDGVATRYEPNALNQYAWRAQISGTPPPTPTPTPTPEPTPTPSATAAPTPTPGTPTPTPTQTPTPTPTPSTTPTPAPTPPLCAPVTFSQTGVHPNPIWVTMTTATAGAKIFYTANGATPTHNGALATNSTVLYSTAAQVPNRQVITFKAVAWKEGMSDSAVATIEVENINPQLGGTNEPSSDEDVEGTGIAPLYDYNGNLIDMPKPGQSDWTYEYDAHNLMISATHDQTRYIFGYDTKNRCIYRGLWAPSPHNHQYQTDWYQVSAVYYYYDGWELIQEEDENETVLASYVHGAHEDELIAQTNGYGTFYYQADAEGSVVALTDGSGNVLERYTYDVYGKARIYTSAGQELTPAISSYGNRFLFTGREYLPELGLYDYRNRVYSPELGRFLQADPKSFDADPSNLYRYCHNDPVDRTDPTGLDDSIKLKADKTTQEPGQHDATQAYTEAVKELLRQMGAGDHKNDAQRVDLAKEILSQGTDAAKRDAVDPNKTVIQGSRLKNETRRDGYMDKGKLKESKPNQGELGERNFEAGAPKIPVSEHQRVFSSHDHPRGSQGPMTHNKGDLASSNSAKDSGRDPLISFISHQADRGRTIEIHVPSTDTGVRAANGVGKIFTTHDGVKVDYGP